MPDARRHILPELGGLPVVKRLVQHLSGRGAERVTLLAVCPNSEAVVRAALRAAEAARAPLLLAATLNQVDLDGGYTGWTPPSFVSFVEAERRRLGFSVPLWPCLDHGGPWLKDRHVLDGYGYAEAMAAIKRSLEACLDAGYALLHIDPTVDRTLAEGETLAVQQVVERTLELIAHAEAHRAARGYAPVSYEVGTEEVHGGLADLTRFEAFLEGLHAGLVARGLDAAWPAFVVGKVGTSLDTSFFDPQVARQLTERVRPYGSLIKGHYTDYVDHPEAYPRAGIGGANVGPEFTEVEYNALQDLVALERERGLDSGLEQTLRTAVVESGRWTKWCRGDEIGQPFEALAAGRQQWLLRTGSRYVWTVPAVVEARGRLYRNLAPYRDADAYVVERIQEAVQRYLRAFNLVGFADRIERL